MTTARRALEEELAEARRKLAAALESGVIIYPDHASWMFTDDESRGGPPYRPAVHGYRVHAGNTVEVKDLLERWGHVSGLLTMLLRLEPALERYRVDVADGGRDWDHAGMRKALEFAEQQKLFERYAAAPAVPGAEGE
jgi:hypothetical protein